MLLTSPVQTFAKCIPSAIESNCDSKYNCDINWSVVGKAPTNWCSENHPGSCQEVTDPPGTEGAITWCFALRGQPSPTVAPCGTALANCCPAPDLCHSGLLPCTEEVPGQCICKNTCYHAPTAAPNPTAPPGGQGGEIDFNWLESNDAIPDLKALFKGGASQVNPIVSEITKYLFVLAGLLLLFYLIYGGFHMIVASHDEKALVEAKGKITNALVGFLILFLSFWIMQIMQYVLGVNFGF